jgi:hypothetical protein
MLLLSPLIVSCTRNLLVVYCDLKYSLLMYAYIVFVHDIYSPPSIKEPFNYRIKGMAVISSLFLFSPHLCCYLMAFHLILKLLILSCTLKKSWFKDEWNRIYSLVEFNGMK